MRLLALLILGLLLAGCVTPDATNPNPLFGLCPQWEAGPDQHAGSVLLNATARQANQVLAPAALSQHGRPFDMVRIRVDQADVAGTNLQLRAFNETGAPLIWRDLRQQEPQVVPVIIFGPGSDAATHEFEAYLTSVSQDQPARPGPVEMRWNLEGNGTATLSYVATFHYKVCGAALAGATIAA